MLIDFAADTRACSEATCLAVRARRDARHGAASERPSARPNRREATDGGLGQARAAQVRARGEAVERGAGRERSRRGTGDARPFAFARLLGRGEHAELPADGLGSHDVEAAAVGVAGVAQSGEKPDLVNRLKQVAAGETHQLDGKNPANLKAGELKKAAKAGSGGAKALLARVK